MTGPVELVLSRLEGVRRNGQGYMALCPAHDDHNPSLHIATGDDGRALLVCFAGCPTESIVEKAGLGMADLFPRRDFPQRLESRIVATYDYCDENSNLIFQVVRFDPKDFRQRRPDPANHDEWLWKLDGCRRVLYRLPETIDAVQDGRTIYIVEGEKDVLSLVGIGLDATCNSGGAGKWRDEYSETLRDANVVIIPDNDEQGRKHAEQVARCLTGIATSVKILSLPDPGKDASDWITAGGMPEQLEALAAETPDMVMAWKPEIEPARAQATAERAEAIYTAGDLPTATATAWRAIERANNPPRIFVRGGCAVRIGTNEEGHEAFEELTIDRMRHEVARAAPWKTRTKKGAETDAKPPMDVIRDMLAMTAGKMPLPAVQRLAIVPTFAPNGTLCDRPGYNPAGRVYYSPPPNLNIPMVQTAPTEDDVGRAVGLVAEPFADFPFKSNADLTHAVAFLLLPFVRSMVDGPTPISLFEAPVHGSGKGLARDVALHPATGGTVGVVTYATEDELRKTVTARLLKGQDIFSLDNVSRLDSAVLSAAVTAYPYWSDRHLGLSKELTLPSRHTIWSVTANNPTFSGEVARRCVRVRIEPNIERPWERDRFRYPDLRLFAAENRGRLVAAALTLCQAWIADGMPPWRERTLGSFEAWTRIMGGILVRAGFKNFLGNLDAMYEATDLEGAAWRGFTTAWWAEFAQRAVGTAELFPIAEKSDGFDLGKGMTERALRIAFGKKLRAREDWVIAGFKIAKAGTLSGASRWQLIRVGR